MQHTRRAALLFFTLSCASPQSPDAKASDAGGVKLAASTAETTPAPDSKEGDDDEKWDVNDPPGDWGWKEVALDTTEGTWMSLDVSPDGTTLVFDLLGDIYAVPMQGGDAKPLRSGIAWHMQPRFSPDGTKIAFTSDAGAGDNLWVMNADGSQPRQVTQETFRLLNNPAWDPTGQYLVAKKHFTSKRSLGAGEMWLFHISGGEGVQMTQRPDEQKDVNDPAFSPDGRYLYYNRDVSPGRRFLYNKDSSGEVFVIERLDRETGKVVKVTGGPGGAVRPTPSPDGKTLAFLRRVDYETTLFVRDLESGAERAIVSNLERDNQEAWSLHGQYPAMAWTPGSESIVYWDDGGIRRVDVASGAVTKIPFRVATTKKIARTVRPAQKVAPGRLEAKMLRGVVVSPRGNQVAYEALGHIYVKDLPDGTPRRLTGDDSRFEHDPAYSPDGRSIVFATWHDRELGDLRLVPVSGGRTRVLTPTPGHYVDPELSPDGETLVYERVSSGYLMDPRFAQETGLFAMSLAGGDETRITENGTQAHFGARNDRIYFLRAEGDETSDTRLLVSFDRDERSERVLYTSDAAQAYRVAPNGQWLAFRERFNVYVTPFVETGRTVTIGRKAKGIPVAQVTKEAGSHLAWSGDSSTLHWSLGPELFTRSLTDAFAFLAGAPEQLPEPPATGQSITFSYTPDAPKGVVAVTGARVVTMKGDEVIEDGVVVVEGNRIAAVGTADSVTIPKGAYVVDARGKTMVPGLIDAHAHGAQGRHGIIPQHNWGQFANLAFGVTTIHDPSNDTEEIFTASEMQRAGLIRAPRIYSTGRILYGAAGADYKAEVESLDDALFHLRRLKAVGAFSVKSYNQPRRDQRQKVMEAARQLDMQVMPEGGSTFMHNMTMLVDGHTTIEHNIPVETLYDDVLQLWAKSDVANTPTLVVSYGGLTGEYYWYQQMDVWKHERLTTFVPHYVVDPRARRRQMAPEKDYNHIRIAESLKALVDRGRLVNAGAHGQLAGLALHWEIWMFEQGGMSPLEALRGATLNPARTLGMEQDLGSIEVGKLADLVLMDRNPLEDIRHTDSVSLVMLNGRLFDAATLNQLGNETDTVGSDAFGEGPNAIGIGQWWGDTQTEGVAHTTCSCGRGR